MSSIVRFKSILNCSFVRLEDRGSVELNESSSLRSDRHNLLSYGILYDLSTFSGRVFIFSKISIKSSASSKKNLTPVVVTKRLSQLRSMKIKNNVSLFISKVVSRRSSSIDVLKEEISLILIVGVVGNKSLTESLRGVRSINLDSISLKSGDHLAESVSDLHFHGDALSDASN